MFARSLSSWGRLLGLRRASATVEEDRRAQGRIGCNLETTCRGAGGVPGSPLGARVKNVSLSGVCLVVNKSFRPGELVSVALPGIEGEDACEVLACVVRCDPDLNQLFELGCTFATPLTEEDLHRFEPLEKHSKSDQRSRPRFGCRARALYQLVRTPEPTDAVEAIVINVSGGGIALLVNEALAVGDLLSIEMHRDAELVVTALGSIVRTAVTSKGERLVGCNFIHELSEQQLERLLA